MEWVGTPFVAGSSHNVQYALVTLALFGIQFVWSIEQAYVNVYLLDLGITKSSLSLVWLTGPICGLIVQPVAGVLSDYSFSTHGRRRPFMVWGGLATAINLLAFAYARELSEPIGIKPPVVGVLAVVLVNVAINTCQAASRALIVDMFGSERQADANGWASRMSAVGHLVSYGLGALDLTVLGFQNQMKAASVVYSIILLTSVAISSCSVKERILVEPLTADNETGNEGRTVKKSDRITFIFKSIWDNILHLDQQLANIFKVQLFAWYAWFTLLFYGATYAAEIWQSQHASIGQVTSSESDGTVGDLARVGSFALLALSVSATVFSFLLPRFKLNMGKVWFWSLIIYAVAASATVWATTFNIVLIIFVVIGYSWAVTLWIPFALTAKRIHELPNTSILQGHEFEESALEEHDGSTILVDDTTQDSATIPDSHDEKSGIILGIHNSALTFPQFVSAFGSYVIFRIMDSDPNNPHDDGGKAIATALQVGAFAALLGAFYAFKLGGLKRRDSS